VTSWAVESRPHPGVVFTDDALWPRIADTTGKFVDALIPLLRDDDLADRNHGL
jgi:hypothetical protein